MPNKTRLLALIASLSAANVGFRIALTGGPPNVKPIAFLVIVAGVVGGVASGFAVGWLSMSISDLYFGAGIWTVETSAGMAVVGVLGALFWNRAKDLSRLKMAAGGFFITLVFDVGTSIVDALLFNYPWWTSVLALYVPFMFGGFSPYPFGLVHELTTAVLMGAIGPSLITRIRRIYV